jgi:hypothetical protein
LINAWGLGHIVRSGGAPGQDERVSDRQLAAALAGSAASAAAVPVEGGARSALTSTEARRWRWVLHPDCIDLYADIHGYAGPPVASPDDVADDQLVLLSSGSALHHARVALAADGRAARVRLLPDDDPTHLATVTADERITVTAEALARYETLGGLGLGRRHHHGDRPTPAELDELREAAAAEGVRLVVLDPDQVLQLASPTRRRPAAGGDVFGVLCGQGDAPEHWLRAGAALSAIEVLAARRGLTVVPSTAAVQLPRNRALVRRLLPEAGTPYLAVRIGASDAAGHA